MFFDDSSEERRKRAQRAKGGRRLSEFASSPIPAARSYELLTINELLNGGHRTLVFDVESYKNYFLVSFKCVATNKIVGFEDWEEYGYSCSLGQMNDTQWLEWLAFICHRFRIVGFNSGHYDLAIVSTAIQGVRAEDLFRITQQIIVEGMQSYEVMNRYGKRMSSINHIDIINVAPITASLKIYAGRIHAPRMQDLPFAVDTILTTKQAVIVRDYNINDLDNTHLLFDFLKPEIELRESLGKEYKRDLRSKSDAQIAEAVIIAEIERLGANRIEKPDRDILTEDFYYNVPSFVQFKTPQFQQVLEVIKETPFKCGASGSADCPAAIEALKPKLGNCTYRLGAGGLHSSEESQAVRSTDEIVLLDRDVASYYPQIILNLGLFPKHLGELFLKAYRKLVQTRLAAKRAKRDTEASSLKIVVNGGFGKLGNLYSKLFSPDLLIQVTVTGQLCLMMLIEAIELVGIHIVSANTDGIVIACPRHREKELEAVIIAWEEQTGFVTEETRYAAVYSRDVNNYIAVKENGECKTKGVYSEKGSALNSVLSKNPESLICSDAVQALVSKGIPIEHTIEQCQDVRRFINVRTVKGGAEKDGVYLGKAIRWYYAQGETGCINYAITGNKVPKSDGARPLMTLPSDGRPPADLDRDRYINDATEILYEIGYLAKVQTPQLF